MEDQIKLKTYNEVLEELQGNSHQSHLLLGNGFNLSLGIKTDYKSIFQKMKEGYLGYKDVEGTLNSDNYDIEVLISELKHKIQNQEANNNFLHKYIENIIKFDFMKATYGIVKKEINEIYRERNQNIHLMLKNFTNYFTLNYDPLLYLLLMKFKKDKKIGVAFQNTELFQKKDLDRNRNRIYAEIKKARNDGSLTINVDTKETKKNLKQLKKTDFCSAIKNHFADKNWKSEDMKQAINLIWQEETHREVLDNVNDGFFEECAYQPNSLQNLFFLHGTFHIYKDKKRIKKITQKQDKALYERLEEIINNERKDTICVLTGTSEEKEKSIIKNDYLKRCSEKLSTLTGSLVILGSSLGDNDQHIFNRINKSLIDIIYLSSCKETKTKDLKKAKKIFSNNKTIILFDYETISYET